MAPGVGDRSWRSDDEEEPQADPKTIHSTARRNIQIICPSWGFSVGSMARTPTLYKYLNGEEKMKKDLRKSKIHILQNSTAKGNQHRLHASVGSSSSLETSAAWVGLLDLDGCRPPAVLRLLAGSLNQNPICLYFLFSAGSPCGCSFDGQVERSCERDAPSSCTRTSAGRRYLECVPSSSLCGCSGG